MNALVKSQSRSFAYVLICLLVCGSAWAQPVANFTASPQSGCSPLVVYFTDQSSGNPSQWKWDLGNGSISTLQNPSATYFNPGSYTIKLVVKNAAGADSIIKSQLITVYANPVSAFASSDTTGCYPLAINFTDNSQPGSGQIVKWQWDFGDGNISELQHPGHVYTATGNYNVTLKVINSFGCVKTITKTKHIVVSNGVNAAFKTNATNFCISPANVQFTNQTSGSGNSYVWDFGDGQSSTSDQPVHTYSANGFYTVKLIAISPEGCRDTIIKNNLVKVGTSPSFASSSSICTNQQVQFTNTSQPAPVLSKWYFSDGTIISALNAVKTFSSVGVYQVKLVNDYGSCKDSIIKQVTVSSKPTSAFNAPKKSFCQTPVAVSFQSQSNNAVSWLWNFGDGTTATLENPVHTYQSTGNYHVSLIVTNASGCSDTLKKNNFINIQKPQISLSGLPATGCIPVKVKPTANIISSEPVTSWLWKFGDGTTSTVANPEHLYTTAGNYNITLIVTTASGCTDSIKMINAVRAGNKPDAQFSALPPEVCNVNPVHFSDNSTGSPDQWYWFFGDSLSSTEQNPSHVFGNIGRFDVTLIVWNNTCPDTIIKKNVVNVLPPLALYNVVRNCNDKYSIGFIDKSVGATSVLWDFGDGTTSTSRDVTHTYSSPGKYKVVYKVFNNNCWNINDEYFFIVDEKPNVVADKNVVCKGEPVQFSSPGVADSNIINWNWNFGDGQKSSAPAFASHTYDSSGTFRVILTIKDKNNCISKDTMFIVVNGPTARFTHTIQSPCLDNNLVLFNSTSLQDASNPIMKYRWDFGDGIADSSGVPGIQHHYAATGQYSIKLTVTDSRGCTDAIEKNAAVNISKPVVGFTASDTISCTGKDISFQNTSSGNKLKYKWNFGDGNTSTVKNPVHAYSQTGIYTIQLVITDKYGCQDSLTRTNYIQIALPRAKFSVSDSVGTCPPLMVNFTNQSSGYNTIKWHFGDGSTSILENPSHFYNTPGIFYAKLVVTAAGGCTDSAIQKIVVKGPNGQFSYSPLAGCNPLTVSFTATTRNTTSFIWDFSDGATITGNKPNATHVYSVPGIYVPRIILTDASGCHYPLVGKDTIRVYDVQAGFTMNANRFCTSGLVQFTNTTISNDLISGYQWNFGDGNTSTENNPSHQYTQPGIYTVQLVAVTANGCSDAFILKDTITILQAPSINIESKLTACVPAEFIFKGLNAGSVNPLSWQWNFDNGQTSVMQNPPLQLYNEEGEYLVTAIAKDLNGCSDTAAAKINVHPLPLLNAGEDVAICHGESIQLNATGASRYSWEVSPSLDCLACPDPKASPVTDQTYVVTGYNQWGCQSSDSVNLKVRQPFQMQVSTGDTICVGGSVNLIADGAEHYNWAPSYGVQHSSKAQTVAYPSTSTTYTVIGRDDYNCFADTASVFIKVWNIPTVNAGADQLLVVGNTLQLKATGSVDVSNWQWSHAGTLSCATCPVTLASPTQTTTYKVQVTNDGGCMASDDVTINVTCNNGNLFIPNTFSPNGDGVNDRFYPGGTGVNRIKSFRVFNRWGEIVFEKRDFSPNDASLGWDGMFKGQSLSPDVYIWNCEVLCQNNEVLEFKGDVTLLR